MLCYQKVGHIDNKALNKIMSATETLKNQHSLLYDECLTYLTDRGRSSYLLKGWIHAAVNHFISFSDIMLIN